jgi:precorrin-6B methylase 2
MWDIGCITASVAFFLVAIAYTTGCERLGMKENK